MASSNETGITKNIGNFEELITYCVSYGATYKPSKVQLKIPALKTQLNNANAAMTNVHISQTLLDNAISARHLVFDGNNKLATRLVSLLKATNATQDIINDAIAINRKIQGTRATNKKPIPIQTTDTTATVKRKNSTSQKSFQLIVEHYETFITILSAEPSYQPAEAELKLTSLNTLLMNMKTANTNYLKAIADEDNATAARNTVIYENNTGIVDIAQDVKNYVKGAYGTDSNEYKQISSLKFTRKK